MEDEKVVAVGLARSAIGRGWTDVLDNDLAIMAALLSLISDTAKHSDIRQGLQYRINETASYLMGHPVAVTTASS